MTETRRDIENFYIQETNETYVLTKCCCTFILQVAIWAASVYYIYYGIKMYT